MSRNESCPTDREDLIALSSGDLPPERELRVARHLAECATCRETAARIRAVAGSLAGVEGTVRWHRFTSRFGETWVAATDRGLTRLSWQHEGADGFVEELEGRFPGAPVVPDPEGLEGAEAELKEYLRGERRSFDLSLDLEGLSDFDRSVLRAAGEVSFGEVVPYGKLARRIGRPRAARAVGGALGRNPVPIVIPCHRVVRSDGGLGGYGSGVEYKKRLLSLEGREDLVPQAG